MPTDPGRLNAWGHIQQEIAECGDGCGLCPGKVTCPLAVGEIPDPPDQIDILFVGVAPTAQEGRYAGTHFYSNKRDLLRLGLFRLLSEKGFDVPLTGLGLDEGNRRFHDARCFVVHAAEIRPVRDPAPPPDLIPFCARRHLRKEIPILNPRVVCFLGSYTAGLAATALFGRRSTSQMERVELDGWPGMAAVAHQPRRGWEAGTRTVLNGLWAGRPESSNLAVPSL